MTLIKGLLVVSPSISIPRIQDAAAVLQSPTPRPCFPHPPRPLQQHRLRGGSSSFPIRCAVPIDNNTHLSPDVIQLPWAECGEAVEDLIRWELNASCLYTAMYAFFIRKNIRLTGLADFSWKSRSTRLRHVEKLMYCQAALGGYPPSPVPMTSPVSGFEHAGKGVALNAMEIALSTERFAYELLRKLHTAAPPPGYYPNLVNYVESELLTDQAQVIEKISGYVAHLREVGKGHDGVSHFDQTLLRAA